MTGSIVLERLECVIPVVESPEVWSSWTEQSVLPGYTVGGLVAHLLTATERTAVVLEAPEPSAADIRVVGLADFYGPNRVDDPTQLGTGLHAFLLRDGARRANEGPGAMASAFRALPARLRPLLDAVVPTRLVPVVQVPGGATSLDEYLVTRLIELVVHTDDLTTSVDIPPLDLPPAALRVVLGAFVDLAVARVGGLEVIRAFTRRERAAPDVLRVL